MRVIRTHDILPAEYDNYANHFIQLAKDYDLITGLERSMDAIVAYYTQLPSARHNYAYAADKWTNKEVLQHLIDVERIFDFRALWFARGCTVELPGFDPDNIALAVKRQSRDLSEIIQEYKNVRASTIDLFRSFSDACLARGGIASGTYNSVRVLGFRLVGHDFHHLQILKDRYAEETV